ncbi:MAG: RagB/SusD family nutrient uptake outer membrane protein [Candidatus Ordinivivax streblomastigis]|uniref:RagB/SusD family nutrient uptake outer membrane protein n=1 Tax=Candidatus Ordinivivax streblomastigis TaxID=2540710 RepID=A0A5M8NTK1_9BACT|nr:MAG: RagB/SusD family nutrient uptake outer membrane protein [Candidatus Ordinivivax streblomastigis]
MKTIYRTMKAIGLISLILWMTSCQDLLTEDPKGQLATINFFSEKGDLDLALNALYSILAQDQYANNQIGCNFLSGDDITTHPASNKQSLREYDQSSVSDNNTWMVTLWEARWRLVKAANFIINNAERTPDVLPDEIKAAMGQAYYWRAYSYFYLVTAWGAVPLILNDEVNYEKPLTPAPEIYDLIVADLKKAEEGVPDNYSKAPYARNGMNIAVSKGAVKATLAYVYLSMAGWPMNKGTEYYQLAAEKAREVIDGVENGTYYYSLLDEYGKVYAVTQNERNPEVLLGVYFNREKSLQNTPVCDFLQDMSYGGGWDDTHGEIKFWTDFPEGPRKEASYFPQIMLLDDQLYDWWYDTNPPSRAVIAPCFMKTTEGVTRGADFDYTNPATISYEGEKMHQVIRLSEVYCWYAEAVGRSGQTNAKAIEVLNKVRNRANGHGPVDDTQYNLYPANISSDDLAEAAYNEHGWEIAGYYWGNLAPRARDMFRMYRIKEHFEFRKQNPPIEVAPGIFRKEAVPVTGEWSDSKMYSPYPYKDTAVNPNLKK